LLTAVVAQILFYNFVLTTLHDASIGSNLVSLVMGGLKYGLEQWNGIWNGWWNFYIQQTAPFHIMLQLLSSLSTLS